MSTENEQLDTSEGGVSLADYGSTSAASAASAASAPSSAQQAERRESAPAQLDASNIGSNSNMNFHDDNLDTTNTNSTPDTAAAKSNGSRGERVAFLSSTRDYHDHSHHHHHGGHSPRHSHTSSTNNRSQLNLPQQQEGEVESGSATESMTDLLSEAASSRNKPNDSPLRRIAIDLSLWINIAILVTKIFAYAMTLSLSVLAALTDSVLDVVSQLVLNYTEKHSSLSRSSALYPAGASRLEPLGVLICAALMGMASFEIIKESCESLLFDRNTIATDDDQMTSFLSMLAVVGIKLALWALCNRAARTRIVSSIKSPGKQSVKVADPTLEALAQDHFNDCLSNAVAAIALLFALKSEKLWFLDPVGAILISLYIIYSWYETGKEQIEQLTGKSAPDDFIDEIMEIASNFDSKMLVDVCRAYHFGPKFLVELEVVLPRDTLLEESHDLGMDLQYEIEAMEEVERCFVHIDYETRPYDEHVVSKVPELRERILRQQSSSCIHSV